MPAWIADAPTAVSSLGKPVNGRASHGQLGSKPASSFPPDLRAFGQLTPNISKVDNESFVGDGTT